MSPNRRIIVVRSVSAWVGCSSALIAFTTALRGRVLDHHAGAPQEGAGTEADDLRAEPQRACRERRPRPRRGLPEVDADDPALQRGRLRHRPGGELRAAPDQVTQVVVVELAER